MSDAREPLPISEAERRSTWLFSDLSTMPFDDLILDANEACMIASEAMDDERAAMMPRMVALMRQMIVRA